MNINIDCEEFSKLVAKDLKDNYWMIKNQYDDNVNQRIFYIDDDKDRKAVKKFLKALKKVHNHYSIYSINEHPHEGN
jgi:hypothetical protein